MARAFPETVALSITDLDASFVRNGDDAIVPVHFTRREYELIVQDADDAEMLAERYIHRKTLAPCNVDGQGMMAT